MKFQSGKLWFKWIQGKAAHTGTVTVDIWARQEEKGVR